MKSKITTSNFSLNNNNVSLAEMRKIYAKSGFNYTDEELIKIRDWLGNLADIALAIVEHNGVDNMNEIIERANKTQSL